MANEMRKKVIQVTVTEAEYQQFKRQAEATSHTLSSYIRHLMQLFVKPGAGK